MSNEYDYRNVDLFFENFILGKENEFAHAVVCNAIMQSGEVYNPVFVVAEGGNGKTHLMTIVTEYAKEHGQNVKVVFATDMQEQICTILREMWMKKRNINCYQVLYEYYKDAQVVIIENLEMLIDMTATLEFIFDFIDILVKENKQVFITSSAGLDKFDDYSSVFKSKWWMGIEADVSELGNDYKIEVVGKIAEYLGIFLTKDQKDAIAVGTRTIGQIIFVLNEIKAHSELSDRSISDVIKKVLEDYL